MKKFTFKYEKNSLKNSFKEMKRSSKQNPPVVNNDKLVCNDIETMSKILSKSKLDIFSGLLEFRPNSIADLAKLLGKAQANVLRDVRSLELIGLIKLKTEMDGERERLRPIAIYNQIVFDFGGKAKKRAS